MTLISIQSINNYALSLQSSQLTGNDTVNAQYFFRILFISKIFMKNVDLPQIRQYFIPVSIDVYH